MNLFYYIIQSSAMARQLWPRLGLRRYSGQKTPALDIPKMDFILVIRRLQHNYTKNHYLPILKEGIPVIFLLSDCYEKI